MKQKDIALIIVIVFVSAVLSLFISKAIFTSPKNRQQQVEVVQAITADFPQPNHDYFNEKSFNPASQITIGQNDNNNPFSKAPE